MNSERTLTRGTHGPVEAAASNLLTLPNEVLDQIITLLNSAPPSLVKTNERPDAWLTISKDTHLKHVSRTSRKLRILTVPYLFRHARLQVYQLGSFLTFISGCGLNGHVATVTITLADPSSHIEPVWWLRLLDDIPLTVLIVHGAPHMFSDLAQTSIDDSHAWAFNMPFHTLTLSQDSSAAHRKATYPDAYNLLTARPWTGLKYNEGSSLIAYATYEYFLKRTPSLFASLDLNEIEISQRVFRSIETFSFVAIFPFYNHVDEIFKCIRHMKNLKQLFIKLCPEPESTILAEEIAATNGHIDVNDPWLEFHTSLSIILSAVKSLASEGNLEILQMDDVKVMGIRDSLKTSVSDHLQDEWLFEGSGVWRRQI